MPTLTAGHYKIRQYAGDGTVLTLSANTPGTSNYRWYRSSGGTTEDLGLYGQDLVVNVVDASNTNLASQDYRVSGTTLYESNANPKLVTYIVNVTGTDEIIPSLCKNNALNDSGQINYCCDLQTSAYVPIGLEITTANSAEIYVNGPTLGSCIFTNYGYSSGYLAEFGVIASYDAANGETVEYQWKEDTGSGFSDISGATNSYLSLTTPNTTATSYRCTVVFKDSGSSVIATYELDVPGIQKIYNNIEGYPNVDPGAISTAFCTWVSNHEVTAYKATSGYIGTGTGDSASITLNAELNTAETTLNYKWYRLNDNGSSTQVGTTSTLQFNAFNTGDILRTAGTYKYYVKVSSESIDSNACDLLNTIGSPVIITVVNSVKP